MDIIETTELLIGRIPNTEPEFPFKAKVDGSTATLLYGATSADSRHAIAFASIVENQSILDMLSWFTHEELDTIRNILSFSKVVIESMDN